MWSIDKAWSSGAQRYLRVALAMAMLSCSGLTRADAQWPAPPLPHGALTYRVGEQLVVNGVPMRVQGFVSGENRKELAAWFRQNMGKPLMENQIGSMLVLGRPQGEFYLSVQLEIVGHGTRGIVSVSHLKAAYDNRAIAKAELDRMMARFPSGSHLVSVVESIDRGKASRHLVVSNSYQEDLNGNRIAAMMRDDGLTLEQTASVDGAQSHAPSTVAPNGKTLYFKGAGKEAIAVIFRDPAGRVTIVLNTISTIARYK